MREITLPRDITLAKPYGADDDWKPETVSWKKYFFKIWADDNRAITTGSGPGREGSFKKQQRWAKVLEKVGALPDSIPPETTDENLPKLLLEDEDYETLKALAEKPGASYPASTAVQLAPHHRCVIEAKKD